MNGVFGDLALAAWWLRNATFVVTSIRTHSWTNQFFLSCSVVGKCCLCDITSCYCKIENGPRLFSKVSLDRGLISCLVDRIAVVYALSFTCTNDKYRTSCRCEINVFPTLNIARSAAKLGVISCVVVAVLIVKISHCLTLLSTSGVRFWYGGVWSTARTTRCIVFAFQIMHQNIVRPVATYHTTSASWPHVVFSVHIISCSSSARNPSIKVKVIKVVYMGITLHPCLQLPLLIKS